MSRDSDSMQPDAAASPKAAKGDPSQPANRWYDENEALARHLESFRTMEPSRKDALLREVIGVLKEVSPEVFAPEKVLDFPLDIKRRRWYDTDPYLWLLVNSLRLAGPRAIGEVVGFLNKP